MFSNLLRFYTVCDKVLVRSLRGGRLPPTPVRGPNPGLNRRIKAFQEDGIKIEDDDVEEFVEKSDSDFFAVGETYNEHIYESIQQRHNLRHHIVKEKYFKENLPNLLTWSEKEQIRHLHSEHPDEWTPERLAESFPVTLPIVKKLLKYPWKPATEVRIARHDASAMRNWRELKEGTLDLPENMREHFLKFSERTIPPLNRKSVKIDITQERKMGEFQSIIERCASKDKSKENESIKPEDGEQNHEQAKQQSDNKRVTLEELTNKIKSRMESGTEVNMPDQIIVSTVDSNVPATNWELNKEIQLENNEENALTYIKEDKQEVFVKSYPERIRIPKKAYKKGATYKVNDCYYDDDGRFLYRVIGMTN